MESLIVKSNPEVAEKFDHYPAKVKKRLEELRALILEVAREIEDLQEIEEDLRWGEPSYLTKLGSTLRMDWKEKSPQTFALYFKCTSKLVETFKSAYPDQFTYEGKRAIVFHINEPLPPETRECIRVTLSYHKVKHLDLLGLILAH